MRRGSLLVAITLVVGFAATARSAMQTTQRDANPAIVVTGTAEISGHVLSDDASVQPVRRAIVTVTGAELPTGRSALTDDDGAFSIPRLPAGRFTVRVKKVAYLMAAYGANRPGRDGSEIALAAGQRTSITIRMARGAVITGTLRDENGQPISGATVYAIDMHGPGVLDNFTTTGGDSAVTDDHGAYRIFGLMPSEYVIGTTPSLPLSGPVGARSPQEMDALLATLAQRRPNGAPAPPPSATSPLLPAPGPVGIAPVYYPSGSVFADAVRIPVSAGEERSGIDLAVVAVPVASVSGVVTGDVPNLATVQISLIFIGPRIMTTLNPGGISGQPPDAEGKFKFSNIAPGGLRIVARARRGVSDLPATAPGLPGVSLASGGGGAGLVPATPRPANAAPGEMLYGVADFDVRGQDITGVTIALQPGATLTGRVVFDAERTTPPTDLTKILVSASMPNGSFTLSSGTVTVGPGIVAVPNVAVRADGTFELTAIGPAQYRLGCQMPADLSSVWKLRSAMAGGRDLLDAPLELLPGTGLRDVVLTLSDKRTEINGTLQTPTGQPATAYYVIAFPEDRALWQPGSRRIKSARPATDGRFVFADLPPGKYLLATLTDFDPNDLQTPTFLEQVAPAGVPVALGEGEKKTQDLKIVG